ncbi:MAG: hypothetical protein ACRCX2_28800, partial [Paraclostridium sp.]
RFISTLESYCVMNLAYDDIFPFTNPDIFYKQQDELFIAPEMKKLQDQFGKEYFGVDSYKFVKNLPREDFLRGANRMKDDYFGK